VIYIDANVFVLANLDTENLGNDARTLLRYIQDGRLDAASSVLSFDEVVWAVKKNRTPEASIMAGEAFMNMPGLKIVVVDRDLLAAALTAMRKYRLDPRDSIHIASALREDAEVIVSYDRHFDRVGEIKRMDISGVL
jgi:predicted nucleic acid-binding protein